MPRRPRINLEGIPQHIVQRGNNRPATFFAESDYRFYLDRLEEAAHKYDCAVYAYVIMTNHVHLLASTGRPYGLSSMMQYIGRYFVRYINRVYRRSGTLWEGRFKAALVDTDVYFLRCCRYIECNPVRARIVTAPGAYPWSSYSCHALGIPDRVLSAHVEYNRLGTTGERRQRAYRALFDKELESAELSEIRETVNSGWPLGNDRFKDEIETTLKRAARPPRRGRPTRDAPPSS